MLTVLIRSRVGSNRFIRLPSVSRRSFIQIALYLYAPFSLVDAETFGDFTYSSTGSSVTITAYTGPGGNISIPEVIAGQQVTGIGDSAFQGRMGLTVVTIPNGVVNIENWAFFGCSDLTKITLPDSVTNIGDFAFSACRGLEQVAIPGRVARIGYSAFSRCVGLTNVSLSNGIESIGGGAFFGCAGLAAVGLPDSVNQIGDAAFAHCNGLTNLGVGRLNMAYAGLDGVLFNRRLTTLVQFPGGKTGRYTVPVGVTEIADRAFSFCTNVTEVAMPESVARIGNLAFSGCAGLASISVNPLNNVFYSVDGVLLQRSQEVLLQCPAGKAGSYSIPGGVTSIGDGAFTGCKGLTQVAIPNTVTRIGTDAFAGCTGLTEVNLPRGVVAIGPVAFYGCTGLLTISIPDTVTDMGVDAFFGCTRLVAFVVDEQNPVYGSLDGVLFNHSFTTLIQCPRAKAATYAIPNGVTQIGDWAFRGCGDLTQITIPGSVAGVGSGAFSFCTGLTTIIIPGGVTNIGIDAFSDCSHLGGVYFEGNAPDILPYSLFYDSNLVTVYYRIGATGWGATWGGRPTALWVEPSAYPEWAQAAGLLDQYPNAGAETDDADMDGMNNLSEMLAGTDPIRRDSVLKFETIPRANDLAEADRTAVDSSQRALYWQSIPGRSYQIQTLTDIGGAWQALTNMTATTTQKRIVIDPIIEQGFYRVVLIP